jgi:hypothetical protein
MKKMKAAIKAMMNDAIPILECFWCILFLHSWMRPTDDFWATSAD